MNLPFFVAKRYFIARKKTSFISLISWISMLGVCVGTMALVIVLSVFNGLEAFQKGLFRTFDAEIKISAKKGKNFVCSPAFIAKLQAVNGVSTITQIIQESALIRYKDAQMVVTLKGVDDNFLKQQRLKSSIIDGELKLGGQSIAYAVVGSGVAFTLGVDVDAFYPLETWYPHNNHSKTIDFNSTEAFNRLNLLPVGIFAIEQEYDNNFVFVPLSFAQELFEYGSKRTSLEIQVKDPKQIPQIQSEMQDLLGEDFVVQNQDEQHASLLRAIKIEKLFVFLTLSFIIGIASFNIFFSLSMLAIEKKPDVKTLRAMGASKSIIKRIFLFEGAIVAFSGAIVGLILGFTICWLQEMYGFVSMGIVGSLVDAYPVEMRFNDFFFTAVVVIIMTLCASYFPAKRAVKF